MYRVVILTLTGLFVVFVLASAPEFRGGTNAASSSHTRAAGSNARSASDLTYQRSSDQLRGNAFRTIPVTAQQ
ncbi:hypothetical protein QWZ10_13015 [Paracoccus cavernae]|uniref:Secreted protein n=1 Tax=Paracoccus cavernae TaxID=1571207 RepID=A0ABT8D825_9RHOB|nr:hypothetical protein [Paracoccus cavernae]